MAELFFKNPDLSTPEIAQKLLGCRLRRKSSSGVTSGIIVETEAYLGESDQAAHVYGGKRTASLEAFYQEAGIFYIYNIHGHWCVNMITQSKDEPQGVLIRALEPVEGIDLMQSRRKQDQRRLLTNGPGKLSQALGVDKEVDYGTSILQDPLTIDFHEPRPVAEIARGPRIGISNKGEWTHKLLRFYVKGNPYVSSPKGRTQTDHGWLA
ncbi:MULTISPECIES: DNA-3-methyladenine glycosylase [Aerococcus]|uniref:DNA-3-methyladenine glycosylase n=1 Tax=Aerococcus TaxID=1375 RepID=UPI000DCDDB68|nr:MULTISPECIES: DNA-3-methyladenine glycosylase [Aerococcus]KAA9299930.1 DNA-3-methyladenine glycosylase [Aerococcus tenax]MDK6688032.1 DNA-3-methyladenine glycosylase [Aerococcus urinae]MDK8132497.1 DNA-3-methyladenine glycosylase [Aerococcus urinae]MDK8484154.1 DNA-3-methyladenine glycosylase [Aerococcus urinae]MDL5178184.1 DNA-3-methyladenine glycosylase [Aerococcus tenax]